MEGSHSVQDTAFRDDIPGSSDNEGFKMQSASLDGFISHIYARASRTSQEFTDTQQLYGEKPGGLHGQKYPSTLQRSGSQHRHGGKQLSRTSVPDLSSSDLSRQVQVRKGCTHIHIYITYITYNKTHIKCQVF